MLIVFSIAGIIAILTVLDHIMSNSWSGLTSKNRNETVFSTRKKDYGAYQLRVDYSKRLLAILLFLGIGIGGISAASLAFNKVKEVAEKGKIVPPIVLDLDEEKPAIEIPEKEVAQQAAAPAATQFVQPQVVDTVIQAPIVIPDLGLPIEAGTVGSGKDPWGNPGTGCGGSGGGTSTTTTPSEPEPIVDEQAFFKGGFVAMRKFIVDNIRMNSVEGSGKVYVKFIVEKDGSISKAIKLKDATDCIGCLEAAIEVVKAMPKWEPAKINGEPVRAWFSLPIVISSGF